MRDVALKPSTEYSDGGTVKHNSVIDEDETFSNSSYASTKSGAEDYLSDIYASLYEKVIKLEEDADIEADDIINVMKNYLLNADESDDTNFEM